jgi:hypothetical protein
MSLARTLATIDLPALNRAQLQMYCRLIREQSGADIRLNSTNEKLREYITGYISEEAIAAREAAKESEVKEIAAEAYRGCGIYITATEGSYTARVRDLDSEIDITVKAPSKEQAREQAIAAIDSALDALIEAETSRHDLPDFEGGKAFISRLDEPIQTELPFVAEVVRDGAKAMLESLEKRSEGAMDESLMQQYIHDAGLYDELEKAWREIPDYEEFSEIFQMDAQMGMIMEILMTEEDHKRYVEVCKAALAVEQDFARKALELLAR